MAMDFGRWLIGQKGRPDWIGSLAVSAAQDPGFPLSGDIAQIRARMSGFQVETDMYEALEDAVREFERTMPCVS